ncbi:MAG: 23S rRNA (guanosine(2251)-2'-O)-methyltransferase RlmB [Clostridia bacterium]
MENKETKGIIAGRNAVMEALKSGRNIDTLFIQKGERSGSIGVIIKKAKDKGITVKDSDIKKLDFLCGGAVHQGVVASAAIKEYSTIEDSLNLAKERGETPFFILCDELTDPQNLGAILRTAECSGVHGVIIPKRRSVSLSYAVGKASAGAVEYMPVIKVNNLASTIDLLKEKGVWVYAADMGGQNWCDVDYTGGGVALVIGSEGQGVQRLVKEKSDFVVSLPMKGQINSLNASVACGILCYEIMKQRNSL